MEHCHCGGPTMRATRKPKRCLDVDNEQNYMKSGNRFKQMTVSKSSAYQNNVSIFAVTLGFPLRNES